MPAAEAQSDHGFFWRKLHSLTGVIPVGAYLLDHLWSNSYALVSPRLYDERSQELQTVPWRIFVEAAVIWIPILYHAFYGVYVWWKGKSNVSSYPWVGNFTYPLQRWTGFIAFAFIGWHVYTERFLTHGKSTFDQVQGALANPYYFAFYLIGVVACCIHLGSGTWNFLCKWGLAATVRAQRMAGYLGVGIAAALSVVAVAVLFSFRYNWHPFIFYVNPPK